MVPGLRCCLTFVSLVVISTLVVGKGVGVKDSTVLLYSTSKDIRMVNLTRGAKLKPVTLVKNLTESNALDFLYADRKICWVDHGAESVQCSETNGTDIGKIDIISSEVLSPSGLACDWFTNKLYWIDSETHKIEVAAIKEKYRKVLFWSDLDQPRAIALAPMKGLMFWTDWGDMPKIERANMDGNSTSRKVIVKDDIFWPNDLSIDYETETIYWLDGKFRFIDRMDYNGKNRERIISLPERSHPYALTHFQTKLYWTDWKTWCIHTYEQNSNDDPKELIHSEHHPIDIHIWDVKKQPIFSHPCEVNNGGCSHLCLLSHDSPGYSCACPIGIKLIDNLTCADGPQEILILARRTDICVIFLDAPDYSHKILPLTDVKYAIAIDYDPITDYIFWTDEVVTKIQKSRLDGSDQSDVITMEVKGPDGIAIDWVARNLYWTDTGTDRIEVVTIDGKYRKVLIYDDLVEPRAIAVAPTLGWMFWSDWNAKKPKIERANLDGSDRELIITTNLGWPNGVTLDLENNKLYWCDAKTDKIEFSNMDGTDRRTLINDNLPHPFGFTLMDDYIYWTDWQKRSIERIHKQSGNHRVAIVEQMPNVMGLKAVKLKRDMKTNPCTENKGGCDHICLYRHNKTYVCACEITYDLKEDGRGCIIPETFLLYSKKESIGRISIENGNQENSLPLTGMKQIGSLDVDTNNMRIYWSDTKLRTIMRSYINGSDPQKVIDLGLASPEGVAIDWIVHNIYWSDPMAHRIEVARLGGSSRRTLLWKDIDEPHSIALNPQEGYMYWSEWGHSNKIKWAAMNGANPKVFQMNTGYATGLTLDIERKRLYWAESTTPSISYVNLNGLNRKVLWSDKSSKPIGLSIYKNLLFWADEYSRKIWKMDTTSPESKTVIFTVPEAPTDLVVVYKKKDRIFNQCAVNNGDCTHLCLTIPGQNHSDLVSYTCACPTHYILQNNTCIPPKKFMIYSQRNLAVRLLPDTNDCPEAVLPIQGLKGVKAIDYDPLQHYLYWIDGKTRAIKKADATGLHLTILVPGDVEYNPFDLAIDSIGRLLFWSCDSKDVINVTRLDNSSTVGVVVNVKGEKPRLLAIHPTKRLLFYTDVGKIPQLIRTRLDGSQRIVITKGADINAVAVDTENDLVVWAQGHSIHMCNIDGDNQHVLLNESNSRVTQLTVHSGWLYWLDREIQQLQRLELKTGGSRSVIFNHASHILDLVSVKQPEKNHICIQPEGERCSHLCIVNGTNAVCSCPLGLALQENNKTCVSLPECGDDRFTCLTQPTDSKECIPVNWRCDGQADCKDGSDETGCPTCKADQFRCTNGLCIDNKFVCDGIAQCSDHSDEASCCKELTEFQCQTNVCISRTLLCDGNENCANGEDESEEECSKKNEHSAQSTVLIILFSVLSAILGFVVVFIFLKKKLNIAESQRDQSEDPLNPGQPHTQIKPVKLRKGVPDVHMSILNGSESLSYDRSHITGASSSTNGSSSLTCYPRETLNPPPSPATTTTSTRGHSPNSRYRPYRHYKSINQPPPPTPCSTDVADESDYNYPRRYDGGSFPPPPTPRSHCHSESCPPSPSSRSSTYFSPLPPPPSPVTSPTRGYDS